MMGEFKSPGDGIFTHPSSNSNARLYPSLDSLDSFEEIDSDSASVTSDTRSTPPLDRKHLFPRRDFVDHLQPEEVRWFYKQDGDKKWTAFIGYDSLRIECRYRVFLMGSVSPEEPESADLDLILVRGGLYEVNVAERLCKPVYWSGDEFQIMRGMWFNEKTWQPLEEGYADQIETEHLGKFLGHRLDEIPPTAAKGLKPVLHHVKFSNFHIDWNSPFQVFLFSESTSSRLMRAVSNKLGVQKSGTRLYRGYCVEAVMEDKPPDITHLVFVIHGIGQKMDTGSIVKSCKDLRERADYLKSKHFQILNHQNQRSEYLPVEWRSTLQLDGDTVDTITPHKMRGVRTILNSSAMDVLYYTSPLYRSEITHSLQNEMNRLYEMFCSRHPYFEPNGGKVSIVAHSLGAVITYDIITGWNPITMYDQFMSSVIEEEKEQAAGSSELLGELDKAKKRVNELETLLMAIHDKQQQQHGIYKLKFKIENMFCLGSPLGVFLALRGIRPQGKGTPEHIMPFDRCHRLFNIYHPSDPVAYRLEPLVLKHYSTVMPLPIHSHDAPMKKPYTKMDSKAYAAFTGSTDKLDEKEKSDQSDKDSVDSGTSQYAMGDSPAKSKKLAGIGGLWSSISKSFDNSDQMSAELKILKKMERQAAIARRSLSRETDAMDPEEIDHTDLEYRIDYQLREGSFQSAYIAMLTSHTAYWANKDVAFFILTHLHPQLQDL